MKRIKVAHVVNNVGFCGVRTVVHNFMKILSNMGYELFLYCVIKQPDDHAEIQKENIEAFKKLGVKVYLADPTKKNIFVMEDICRSILENKIDILHTHSHKPNIYGRLAGILSKKVKIIAHYHSNYDNKWREGTSLLIDQLLEGYSDKLIAVSESVRSCVAEKVGIKSNKIEVIPNGVDDAYYAASTFDPNEIRIEMGVPVHHKVVGIVGRISEQKAQDDFLRAAAFIKRSFPNATYLIIGQADDENMLKGLKDLTANLGLEKNVIFTGFLGDMPKVLNAIDILVMSSRWEGFGLAVFEAMACGKPVVATNIKPIADFVVPGESALLVPVSSPRAIAESVIFLLKDQGRADEMGRKGMEVAKAFSWEKSGEQLDSLYRDLMGNKKIGSEA